MDFLANLENRSQSLKIALVLTLIAAIGFLDFLTGYELNFALFYVMPIALATWIIDRWHGIIASFISTLIWLGADIASGNSYSHALVPLWNTFIRVAFFLIIAWLLSALKNAMEYEQELAHTDNLTGAVNSRLFFELIHKEIDRSQRYRRPFTIVYIDLDNFKTVNDQWGHVAGDQALCTVVGYAKKNLRKSDVIARLGGDEFGLLLPETSQESARLAVSKLQSGLLEEMRQHNWPITFSMGVLTCTGTPLSTDELVKMADNLMYSVKRGGKNAIKYSTNSN